ncbi:MAG: hypothetical protein JWN18_227 [Parcubacteria group bacterium]|nr:hypothetical protein [Parcubacteria group bacterium]
MNKIGEGYYYTVYEMSPTRVMKKETSYESKLAKLQSWYGNDSRLLEEKISHLEESSKKSIALSKRLAETPELKAVLGNPMFVNDSEYEQDKATLLESFLDQENFLPLLHEYIQANFLLWAFGYGDVVHNFTFNAGVSVVTNKVILLDFNELTQDKESIAKDIETQKWTNQASMLGLKRKYPDLYSQVEALFGSGFNIDNVDKYWASRC